MVFRSQVHHCSQANSPERQKQFEAKSPILGTKSGFESFKTNFAQKVENRRIEPIPWGFWFCVVFKQGGRLVSTVALPFQVER